MIGFNGGLIGATRNGINNNTVPGLWSLAEQNIYRRQSLWPNSTGTSDLLLHYDGSNGSTAIIDSGKNQLTGTPVNGAQLATTRSKFGESSLYLQSALSQYVNFSTSTAWVFSGDFTIETWFYHLGGNAAVIDGYPSSASTSWQIYLQSGSIRFYYSGALNLSLGTYSTNSWVHCMVTRQGGIIYGFVNGSLIGSVNYSSTMGASSTTLRIGSQNGASGYFNGYIDETRIINGGAFASSSFALPAAPYTA